jgi:hypothetical protein
VFVSFKASGRQEASVLLRFVVALEGITFVVTGLRIFFTGSCGSRRAQSGQLLSDLSRNNRR